MSKHQNIALLSSQSFSSGAEGAPEWIHLLPAGKVQTVDGRGPYTVANLEQIIATSFSTDHEFIIDLDHATDKATRFGLRADAYGWVKALEAREDGIWGRVEWTPDGEKLVKERAYRGISPVIAHDAQNNVLAVLRASLVNRPNLRGLTALNAADPQTSKEGKTEMSLQQRMAELLGLEAGASEDEIVAAFEKMRADAKVEPDEALQTALQSVGEALGVEVDDPEAILAAAKAAGGETASLQSQIAGLTTEITGLKDEGKRAKAEAFIDGAIGELRIGLNSTNRDAFISMHVENPERTEKLVSGFPKMDQDGKPAAASKAVSLQGATTQDIIAKANAYVAAQAAAGSKVTFTEACLAVKEGKA